MVLGGSLVARPIVNLTRPMHRRGAGADHEPELGLCRQMPHDSQVHGRTLRYRPLRHRQIRKRNGAVLGFATAKMCDRSSVQQWRNESGGMNVATQSATVCVLTYLFSHPPIPFNCVFHIYIGTEHRLYHYEEQVCMYLGERGSPIHLVSMAVTPTHNGSRWPSYLISKHEI
jgi:hypothetical protein